jgi:hypothetical protein
MSAKLAEAKWFRSITNVQEPVPEQSPVHPANMEPAPAVAVSVTVVPSAKSRVQVEEQSVRPAAETMTTLPAPAPDLVTVSVFGWPGIG